jgi:hypothetical protein
MKNKIAIASAFLAASSFSMGEIVVNEFLSFEGFVDTSYSHTNTENEVGNPDTSVSENSFAVDQVEVSWLFNFAAVSAQVDTQLEGDADGKDGADGQTVEQAFVNLPLANGDVVTVGRYASMLGFEAFEPTGLYQYSTAYGASGLPGYAQGVKYTRESSDSVLGISIQDEAFDLGNADQNLSSSSFGLEVAYSRDLGNGFGVFLGAAFEDARVGDTNIVNAYVTYETGAWIFAAEYNSGNSENGAFNVFDSQEPVANLLIGGADVDVSSGLLMANYAYSADSSITARLSFEEVDNGTVEADRTAYTLAHNKALNDNLALIVEVSRADVEISNLVEDEETTELAVELLFTF